MTTKRSKVSAESNKNNKSVDVAKRIDFSNFEVADNIKLDPEEKILLAGLKESKSIFTEQLRDYYSKTAHNQKKRTKQLSMRLTDDDFLIAKTKSIEEGIPYQVLLASIVHKWLHGKLKEVA